MQQLKPPKSSTTEGWSDGHMVTKLVLKEGLAFIDVREARFLGERLQRITVDRSGSIAFTHPQIGTANAAISPEAAMRLHKEGSKDSVIEALDAVRGELMKRDRDEGDMSMLIRSLPSAMPTEYPYTTLIHSNWKNSIYLLDQAIVSLKTPS